MSDDQIYFSGDPSTDSARRHLERVLYAPQRQRWGWVAAVMAGATAFTMWKVRRARQQSAGETPNPEQPRQPASSSGSNNGR
jgi:hypothetical protein